MKQKNWPWWRNNAINLHQTRQCLREKLAQNGCEAPGNTSLILLQHALSQPKSWILSHGDYQLNPQEKSTLQMSFKAFLQGVPLPYILGHWDFYGRTFKITPNVLIPRPETELLVEIAIQHARCLQKPRIVDVGTGSGVIAVSLAAELPSAIVLGVELSLAALHVAKENTHRLCQSRVHYVQGDLLTAFSGPFNLICANLPYLPRKSLSKLDVSKWEPHLALDGGKSGLDAIRELLEQALTRLTPSGVILLETDAALGTETLASAQAVFPRAKHQLIQDLAGHDRIVEIILNKN